MIVSETAVRTLDFYVNGKWEAAAGSSTHPVTNPATGDVIARVPYATAAQVDRDRKSVV